MLRNAKSTFRHGRHGTLRHMGLISPRWYLMLVMPSWVGLSLLVFGMIWMVRRARRGEDWARLRPAAAIAFAGTSLLYLASTPLVATWMAWTLERQNPFISMDRVPHAEAIVVLGGGQSAHLSEAGDVYKFTHHAGDRMARGIEAFQSGKAPLLVLGGGTFPGPDPSFVGEYLRAQAEARGVPPSCILSCGKVYFTTDEGAEAAQLLRSRNVHSILLCTSAYHLPRARRIYESLGFEVVPLPADFDTQGAAERFSPLMLIPRGSALAVTENCIKEWLGLAVGRLLGLG